MAEGKKGFILYADQKEIFEQLSNMKAGVLIKHIFKYVNDESPESKDAIINLAFTSIKQSLKRDLKHWESIKEVRSKAGKASAKARSKKKHNSTHSTHVKSVQHNSTHSTVKDNVNVNVNVNDNVKETINSFDFDFKDELLNYSKYLKNKFDRNFGHLQVEETIKMLNHWYQSKQDKVNCLSINISSGWKTLNFVEPNNTAKTYDKNWEL